MSLVIRWKRRSFENLFLAMAVALLIATFFGRSWLLNMLWEYNIPVNGKIVRLEALI